MHLNTLGNSCFLLGDLIHLKNSISLNSKIVPPTLPPSPFSESLPLSPGRPAQEEHPAARPSRPPDAHQLGSKSRARENRKSHCWHLGHEPPGRCLDQHCGGCWAIVGS
ncbi:hypothetical protein E2C01_048056 [Portunus trituberculatus]|uniref:Uncharacterized protein n=1 Tax=Portunus trituberculatus TaxID=210409 RepID=A0A5B7G960_PORTR|nr:hypothetical protein [Portunus trituberculatus]